MNPTTVLLPVLAAALAFSSPAAEPAAKPAPEAKPTAPVPTGAAALIARHVKALGGEEVLRAQTVRSLKGDLELAVMPGVTVNFASLAKAPDKLLQNSLTRPSCGSRAAIQRRGRGTRPACRHLSEHALCRARRP